MKSGFRLRSVKILEDGTKDSQRERGEATPTSTKKNGRFKVTWEHGEMQDISDREHRCFSI